MKLRLKRLILKQHPDFFSLAERKQTSTLIWYQLSNPEKNLELAVRVKKINVKTAASRNRLKRKIRAYFHDNLGRFQQGSQLLLVTRGDCGILSPEKVIEDLDRILMD